MILLSPGMGVTVSFTPQMEKRLTQRAVRMIKRSLSQFPELRNLEVRVGHTKTKLGVAFHSHAAPAAAVHPPPGPGPDLQHHRP